MLSARLSLSAAAAGTTTTTTTTGGQGIISRATEAAGAAVGTVIGTAAAVPRGVAGAARAAAESFREGVVEGEMAGDRDVTRVADTAERARERVADTVSATVAPVTERFSGTHSTTAPITTGSTMYPSSRTVGSTIEGERGYDMPAGHPVSATGGTGLSGSTFRTTDLSGMGSPTAAGPMSAGAASPRAGMGMGSALSPSSGSGLESGNQIIAGTAPAEIGMSPMSAGGVTGGPGMSEMAGVTGGPGMSERGRTGVSDITGETTGAVAVEELHHDDLDMFGSSAKGPLPSHRITDSYDTGRCTSSQGPPAMLQERDYDLPLAAYLAGLDRHCKLEALMFANCRSQSGYLSVHHCSSAVVQQGRAASAWQSVACANQLHRHQCSGDDSDVPAHIFCSAVEQAQKFTWAPQQHRVTVTDACRAVTAAVLTLAHWLLLLLCPCCAFCLPTGLKHHQRAMAAAPAGIDESTYSTSQVPDDYSREGRDYSREGGMVGEQRQGGGGLLGAVKRAVGV